MENALFTHVDPLDYLDSLPDHVEFLPKRMTVACQRNGSELKISASYCSNKDQFSKKKGRELASMKMMMDLEIYRMRMKHYRAGNGNKPIGFYHTVVVKDMNDENWYDAAHITMKDFIPQLLEEYSGMKTLHSGRVLAYNELRSIKSKKIQIDSSL